MRKYKVTLLKGVRRIPSHFLILFLSVLSFVGFQSLAFAGGPVCTVPPPCDSCDCGPPYDCCVDCCRLNSEEVPTCCACNLKASNATRIQLPPRNSKLTAVAGATALPVVLGIVYEAGETILSLVIERNGQVEPYIEVTDSDNVIQDQMSCAMQESGLFIPATQNLFVVKPVADWSFDDDTELYFFIDKVDNQQAVVPITQLKACLAPEADFKDGTLQSALLINFTAEPEVVPTLAGWQLGILALLIMVAAKVRYGLRQQHAS